MEFIGGLTDPNPPPGPSHLPPAMLRPPPPGPTRPQQHQSPIKNLFAPLGSKRARASSPGEWRRAGGAAPRGVASTRGRLHLSPSRPPAPGPTNPWPHPTGAAPALRSSSGPAAPAAPRETPGDDFTRLEEGLEEGKTYNFSQLFNVVDPSPARVLGGGGWGGGEARTGTACVKRRQGRRSKGEAGRIVWSKAASRAKK